MEKGTVIFVPCSFKRGGFPNERIFIIRSGDDAEFRGVADVNYCYHEDGRRLGDEPAEGAQIQGRLIGVVVRDLGGDRVRVHLPDGEVYDLDKSQVVLAREVKSQHVSV